MSDTGTDLQPLAYATPAASARQGPRVWAAVGILFGGLGLVVLGGCFLMGVLAMIININSGQMMPRLSTPANALMIVLYLMAASCFCGAGIVIYTGVRALVHVVRSPQ